MPVKLPRIQSGRRVDLVANLLRRAISDGHVKAGERFPSEREMAAQLGVGRIVVREALRSLESAGLVQVKRGVNGGCFVQEITPRDVSRSFSNLLRMARISLQDLLELRLALEAAMLRAASDRATKSDLARIAENIRQTRALLKNGSASELKDKVHEFHTLLAEASRNPLFILLSHSVVDIITQYMTALRYTSIVSRKTVKEHENIYQYLAAGEVPEAISALRAHITEDNHRLSRRAIRNKLKYIHYLPIL